MHFLILFALVFGIIALAFSAIAGTATHSTSVGMQGTIVYSQPIVPQTPSDFAAYPIIREIGYWIFGAFTAANCIVSLLRYLKKNNNQSLQIRRIR